MVCLKNICINILHKGDNDVDNNNNNKADTCLLIDIAIQGDSNVNTGTEKLSKYRGLEMVVNRMWKVRTKTVPLIIGALGTIKKGLDRNLHLLPGHLSARATEDHNNEHCTHHSVSAGVNRFDFLLTSGLTSRRHLIMNRRE